MSNKGTIACICFLLSICATKVVVDWFRSEHQQSVVQYLQSVKARPIVVYKGLPYLRLKTLIIRKEHLQYTVNPAGSELLGDYLAKDADDGVRTVVFLDCFYAPVGLYNNGGSALKHECNCEVFDVADPKATLLAGSRTISGPPPPETIYRTPGSQEGSSEWDSATNAYPAVMAYLSTLQKK